MIQSSFLKKGAITLLFFVITFSIFNTILINVRIHDFKNQKQQLIEFLKKKDLYIQNVHITYFDCDGNECFGQLTTYSKSTKYMGLVNESSIDNYIFLSNIINTKLENISLERIDE